MRKILVTFLFFSLFRIETFALTFAVGGVPSEVRYWEKIVEEFRQSTGIKVTLLIHPADTDQRRQKLVIPLSAHKSTPDVFLMDIAWISQFASSEWLEPLDKYVEEDKFDLSPFFSNIIEMVDRFKGKLIALPVYVDSGLLYYRRDLLVKYNCSIPTTWEELLDCAKKVQSEERKVNSHFYGFLWQGAQYEGLVCTFLEFAGSAGGGIFDKQGELILSQPQTVSALQFMYDLIHTYHVTPPNTFTEMKEEEVRLLFQQGNALFERNWPYAFKLHQSPSSPVKDKVGVAVLPHFKGGKSKATLGGWHIGMSRYAKNKKEAWKFIKFITSYNIQKKLILNLGWNPARWDLYDDPEIKKEVPYLTVLKEALSNALARPQLPFYTQLSDILQRYINSALSGQISVYDALIKAEGKIRRIVEIYKITSR